LVQLELQLIITMNKEKLIKGGMWLSGFTFSILISSVSFFQGFKMMRDGSYLLFIIGILFLFPLFYCAFKGFKLVLEAIFD